MACGRSFLPTAIHTVRLVSTIINDNQKLGSSLYLDTVIWALLKSSKIAQLQKSTVVAWNTIRVGYLGSLGCSQLEFISINILRRSRTCRLSGVKFLRSNMAWVTVTLAGGLIWGQVEHFTGMLQSLTSVISFSYPGSCGGTYQWQRCETGISSADALEIPQFWYKLLVFWFKLKTDMLYEKNTGFGWPSKIPGVFFQFCALPVWQAPPHVNHPSPLAFNESVGILHVMLSTSSANGIPIEGAQHHLDSFTVSLHNPNGSCLLQGTVSRWWEFPSFFGVYSLYSVEWVDSEKWRKFAPIMCTHNPITAYPKSTATDAFPIYVESTPLSVLQPAGQACVTVYRHLKWLKPTPVAGNSILWACPQNTSWGVVHPKLEYVNSCLISL